MDPLTMSLIGGGMNLLGGLFGGSSASDAASSQANAQLEAARIAAEAAKFRPIGVTTGFGSSRFGYAPSGSYGGNSLGGFGSMLGGAMAQPGSQGRGDLVSAGYTMNPQTQALFNQLQSMNMSGGTNTSNGMFQPQGGTTQTQGDGMYQPQGVASGINIGEPQVGMSQPTGLNLGQPQVGMSMPPDVARMMQPQGGTSNIDIYKNAAQANQGLFTGSQAAMNLGNQYLGQSPQYVASQYMAEQNKLLQPSNERALAELRTNLANTGRTGLSISQGGEQAASNPEMQAYYNSLANQQNQLAAGARQAGQENVNFGMGLLGQGGQNLANYYSNLAGAAQPLKTNLDIQRWLDEQAQKSLTLGMGLGSSQAAAGAASGGALQQGFQQAAPYQYAAGSYNPIASALGGLGGMFGNYSRQQAQIPTQTRQNWI